MRSAILIKGGSIGLVPGKKVIKAAEYAEMTEASALLDAAAREAERIRAEAQEAAKSMREKGYRDGLREGKQKMAEKMLETVQRTVDYMASSEEMLCELVVTAVRRVIGELGERERIVRIVRNALAVVRSQKQVVVKVAPQDLEAVQAEVDALLRQFPGIEFIEVVADGRLSPQSCILESGMGIVDASVEVQLAAIRNALMKTIRKTT
ncbi:type III secretion system protein [Thermodesulfomicrobium sp. WS]|uniref:HrpE/YscL family type III secretion apparatus protein n=1 Tax=Thermodesulfomicrobium sp. WS TaxID=3004129 RepID=UPI002491E5FA|nr:HrpE/YscL family type III secretion apparatus protein [Thermodesulfomicrobium sp. WS]BDV01961.1 type III secretion system protein [Thermodesulfomicrobium sp. WS]